MSGFLFLCFGIFLMSFFWWPNAPVPFEVPKVIFFQWFVRILVLVFAASFLVKKRTWKVNFKLFIPIIIFAVWATVSSILGSDISKSFVGNYFRRDGLITLYELIGFSLLVSYFWKEKFKKAISLTLFTSSALLSFLTLIQILRHKFGLGSAVTFGNPVFLAGYLSVAFPFSFYLFKLTSKKIYLICLVVQLLAVVLIGAVSSILTLIIFAILYLLFFQKRTKRFVLISILLGIFSLLFFFWSRNYYLENSKTLIAEGRVRIFQNILRGFVKRPILGYGWANVDYAFRVGEWPMKFNNDVYVDKAHSQLLEILVACGIPGFIIYLSFIFLLLRELMTKYKKSGDKFWNFTLLSGVILYFFHSQTNVISISEEMIFWLILGLTL